MRRTEQARAYDRQPLTLTIPQAAQLLGISVSKAYDAARTGELPTLRVGSRVLISRHRLEELIDGPRGGPLERSRDEAILSADGEVPEWVDRRWGRSAG